MGHYRATPEAAKALKDLIAARLEKPECKFLGEAGDEFANPVFVLHQVEDFLQSLEYLARFENLKEACEALSRGCSWRDYDGKKWSK